MQLHRNSQWLVTHEGLEAIADSLGYWIDMDRMAQETTRSGIRYYDWPIHLAEKEWVDRALFIEAFVHALRFYARQNGEPIDEAMLGRSCIISMEAK